MYICSLFHMRYTEFSGLLYSELAKLYSPVISKEDDKVIHRRADNTLIALKH